MFSPKYTITNVLLASIKRINSLVFELNNKKFPKTVLVSLERQANEISTYASTSIEGNPLPLTDVKRILKTKPENIQKSEQEVLNYNQALEDLNQKLQKGPVSLNLNLILSLHKKITKNLVPDYQLGKLREEPVFVNNPRTGETIYWPPDSKDVASLLNNLIEFINSHKGKIDPLILAGLFHKQFVIIHPFLDGNGRTTRLTTKVLLKELGLDTFNLFSFENYYNQNVTNYFNNVGLLGNYYVLKNIDFTPWLEYFTQGLINELLRVKKELEEKTLSPEGELKLYHQQILKYIKQKGYIQEKDYAYLTARAKATRILDFKYLIKRGLIERKAKGRKTYYILKESL